jgi:hypothetical protein
VSIKDRGFASMNRHRQFEIAVQGGLAVQASGRGRRWTPEEARAASRKAAQARRARKAQAA